MPEEKSLLSAEFEKVGDSLDIIIKALRRERDKPVSHPETIVYYTNNTTSSFNIVRELDENSIPNRTSILKVDIGTNVTIIGTGAFAEISSINEIILPNTLISIYSGGFAICPNLTTLIIPSSIQNIGNYCFYQTGLTEITFEGKTMAQVQAMEQGDPPWETPSGCVIHCTDGDITIS